ncbi:hypothetical protein LTR10_001910 [Elasticomyces elasticus]|nr:hypothetical protein LTR10_001910 [Elasticomyces elasticus]
MRTQILRQILCLLPLGRGTFTHVTAQSNYHTPIEKQSEQVSSIDLVAVLDAMGGRNAFEQIESFTYVAKDIYRSSTVTQTYDVFALDQSVSSAGSQNVSFQILDDGLLTRIDRTYQYNEYWTWAFPDLSQRVNMSVVIHDTADGFACVSHGSNNFFASNLSVAAGYTDPYLTDYLIHKARQTALPWLLRHWMRNATTLKKGDFEDPHTLKRYTTFDDHHLDLSLLVDPESNIPRIIRAYEVHEVYGLSTSDLLLSEYRKVSSMEDPALVLPHRLQTIYNSEYLLEDFLLDDIIINPGIQASFFDGQPAPANPDDPSSNQGMSPERPAQSSQYPRSEVHEYFETGLWAGPFGESFNISDVVVEHLAPGFANIMSIYVGYPDYVQMLVEHENGFIITDAPAHRSKIILDWLAEQRPDKHITRVVPSHHHRDHAGGVRDYINAGATLVVPEVARDFYCPLTSPCKMQTYDADRPFRLQDNVIDFRSFWADANPHAKDWSFAVASKAKANDTDICILFNADVVNPGTDALRWDAGPGRTFLMNAVRASVPRKTVLLGAHGSTKNGTSTSQNLSEIAETIGFHYPELTARHWAASMGMYGGM